MKPIRSSLPSSSWLVATVVPWLTAVIASPERSIRSRTLRTPVRKPSAGSAGVDGVLVVVVRPDPSSTATTSVNVPPVSMPMRTRRALMAVTLAMRYRQGKRRRYSPRVTIDRRPLGGVYLPLVTPFLDGEVDHQSLERLLTRYRGSGFAGLVLLGTTGESPVLSVEESDAIVEQVAAALGDELP